MADYERGKMEIEEQKRMYDVFWSWCTNGAIIIAVILVLMYIFLG